MHRTLAHSVALLCAASTAGAQHAERTTLRSTYLDAIPPAPPIVAQHPASARFALYGDRHDPGYRDHAPVDGIDDARATRLRALADRFSPLLRRNNFSMPRRFQDLPGATTLYVDRWLNGRLASADSLRLDRVMAGSADDELLRRLLRELGPERQATAIVQPRNRSETILFFDFPGEDETSWRTAYMGRDARPHAYVHAFVDDDAASSGGGAGAELAPSAAVDTTARYRVVLQYWLFYPFNDATNNHEGDWEHLNVHVTTAARFASDRRVARSSPLTAEEVRRIIGSGAPLPLDSLRISRVDHYFHHSVVPVDYAAAHVRPALTPHDQHTTTHVWEDAGYTNWAVRERLRVADGRLATHPVAYIGGDSRGPGELLTARPRLRGSYNRNSHGTYPFPGLWASVGQLAATERIRGQVVPRTRRVGAERPWQDIVDDPDFVVFGANDLTLVPDWERLVPVIEQDAEVRARWAWLFLPAHFGFPTSPSPASGALKRTNLGNVSPHGPAFHPGWNIAGETTEHETHVVTVMRGPAAPAGPWLALQNGWGALNVPLAAWGLMPGYNVAVSTLLPYFVATRRAVGRPASRTLFRGSLPSRVTSTGYGILSETGRTPPATVRGQLRQRAWFDLYFTERFALENAFSWSESRAFYGGTYGGSTGRTLFRQLTGGARYNLTTRPDGVVQTFGRAGYGWTRYDLSPVVAGRDTIAGTGRRHGRLPTLLPSASWWPNTLYAGVGMELFAPKRHWLLHRAGYGLRAEVSGAAARGGVRTIDAAVGMVLGW